MGSFFTVLMINLKIYATKIVAEELLDQGVETVERQMRIDGRQ